MKRWATVGVVMATVSLTLTGGCSDSRPRTSTVPSSVATSTAGTERLIVLHHESDGTDAIIAFGWLRIDDDSANDVRRGTWVLEPTPVFAASGIFDFLGAGAFEGRTYGETLSFNLNPNVADHNLVLFNGGDGWQWEWTTDAGVEASGKVDGLPTGSRWRDLAPREAGHSPTSAQLGTYTIVGRAEDAKLGAVVIDPDIGSSRYISGLTKWPDATRGQIVRVTGAWSWCPSSPTRDGGPLVARIGAHVVILDPEWERAANAP